VRRAAHESRWSPLDDLECGAAVASCVQLGDRIPKRLDGKLYVVIARGHLTLEERGTVIDLQLHRSIASLALARSLRKLTDDGLSKGIAIGLRRLGGSCSRRQF
jgi:hypothetical protein